MGYFSPHLLSNSSKADSAASSVTALYTHLRLILPRNSGHRVKPQERKRSFHAGLRSLQKSAVFFGCKKFRCNKTNSSLPQPCFGNDNGWSIHTSIDWRNFRQQHYRSSCLYGSCCRAYHNHQAIFGNQVMHIDCLGPYGGLNPAMETFAPRPFARHLWLVDGLFVIQETRR